MIYTLDSGSNVLDSGLQRPNIVTANDNKDQFELKLVMILLNFPHARS